MKSNALKLYIGSLQLRLCLGLTTPVDENDFHLEIRASLASTPITPPILHGVIAQTRAVAGLHPDYPYYLTKRQGQVSITLLAGQPVARLGSVMILSLVQLST